MRFKLHLKPSSGDELDSGNSIDKVSEFIGGGSFVDVDVERRNGLDAQLPIVHALGDGEWISRSDVVVVEPLDGGPGVLGVAVSNVAVRSVGSAEFDHQSQFVQGSDGGEDRNQLIFEAIARDSVAVDLGTSPRRAPSPSRRRSAIDSLSLLLYNLVTSGVL